MKKITSCICTYDGYSYLGLAIESLLTQSLNPSEYDIIVLDNSLDQERATKESEKYAKVQNLKYVVKYADGLSGARNECLKLCETEYIHFMDDDAIADRHLLGNVASCFERNGNDCGVVGGKALPRWVSPIPSWMNKECLNLLSMIDWGNDEAELQPSQWLAGVNISFRTSELLRLGGFRVDLGRKGGTNTLLSSEEASVIKKLQTTGKKVMYAPSCVVDHTVLPERLNKGWFIKRVAWQIMSDEMSGDSWELPQETRQNIKQNVHMLFDEGDDSEAFEKRLDYIKKTTKLLFGGTM